MIFAGSIAEWLPTGEEQKQPKLGKPCLNFGEARFSNLFPCNTYESCSGAGFLPSHVAPKNIEVCHACSSPYNASGCGFAAIFHHLRTPGNIAIEQNHRTGSAHPPSTFESRKERRSFLDSSHGRQSTANGQGMLPHRSLLRNSFTCSHGRQYL